MYGKHHTPHSKALMKERATGRKCSAETKAKMAEARRLYWSRVRACDADRGSLSCEKDFLLNRTNRSAPH